MLLVCSPQTPRDADGAGGKGGVIFRGRGPQGRAGASRQSTAPSRCPALLSSSAFSLFEERKKKKKGLLNQIKICLAKVKPILQPELFQLPTGQAGMKFSTWQCQGRDPWGMGQQLQGCL